MGVRAWARTRAEMRSVRRRRSTAASVAGLVFVAAVVVAFPLYLVRGHDQWFFLDEWDFLAARSLTNIDSLLRPHNEHWSTLPIIVYRVLWQLFGLRTYLPYQVIIVSLHLTAAVLLRRIMRRAGRGSVGRDRSGGPVPVPGFRSPGHRLGVPDRLRRLARVRIGPPHPRRPRRASRPPRRDRPRPRLRRVAVLRDRRDDDRSSSAWRSSSVAAGGPPPCTPSRSP